MTLRPLVVTVTFAAATLAAQAQTTEAQRDQLAASLARAVEASDDPAAGSLADRFAQAAKAWAFSPGVDPQDAQRLKRAVKGLREVLGTPAAANAPADLAQVEMLLAPVLGARSRGVVARLQQARFQEIVDLFEAARAAGATPENGQTFPFRGKRYGWLEHQGRKILAPIDAILLSRAPPTTTRPGAAGILADDDARRGSGAARRPGSPAATSVPAGAPASAPSGDAALAGGKVDQRNLDGLDPKFRERVVRILRRLQAQGWQPYVASGRRTLEQQREKVRLGYSQTLNSWHLKGLAADIVDKRWGWGGPASKLSHPFWRALGAAAHAEGLTWGGDWKRFPDVAHVER